MFQLVLISGLFVVCLAGTISDGHYGGGIGLALGGLGGGGGHDFGAGDLQSGGASLGSYGGYSVGGGGGGGGYDSYSASGLTGGFSGGDATYGGGVQTGGGHGGISGGQGGISGGQGGISGGGDFHHGVSIVGFSGQQKGQTIDLTGGHGTHGQLFGGTIIDSGKHSGGSGGGQSHGVSEGGHGDEHGGSFGGGLGAYSSGGSGPHFSSLLTASFKGGHISSGESLGHY